MSPTPLRPPPPKPPPSPFTETEARRIVRERSLGMCEMSIENVCLGRAAGVHHRLKRGQGGRWSPANLLDACGSGTTGCHGYTEAHPTWAKEKGYWLTPDQEPTEVAVHMRWMNERSWWMLDDTGMLTWQGEPFTKIGPGAVPIDGRSTEFAQRNPSMR